jgi:cytochrome P450
MAAAAQRRVSRTLPRGPSGLEAGRFFARGSFEDTPAFLLGLRRRFGPITQFRLFTNRIWIANEPEVVRDVLVTKHRTFVKSRGTVRLKRLLGEGLLTSEEPLHLQRRRLLQPAFHRARIERYAVDMRDEALRETATWRADAAFDAGAALTRLTLAIAARTLFGADVAGETGEVRGALMVAMEMFPRFLSPWSELLDRLPLPSRKRFLAARTRLDAVIGSIVARRRAAGVDTGDLLSMLLLARDEDGSALDDLAVRDEAMTIFLAGHETTANALTWTLYLLAQHPDAAQRLAAEVDALPADVAVTAPAALPYTRAVLSEAMRLFPPAWVVGRRALADVEVGSIAMRRGEVVLMAPYVVHRDPRFYADADAFVPERWLDGASAALPPFAYFPFGGGNRVCIGEQFAWMEGAVVLASIARHWRFETTPDARADLLPLVTLRPKYPMVLVPRRRDAA